MLQRGRSRCCVGLSLCLSPDAAGAAKPRVTYTVGRISIAVSGVSRCNGDTLRGGSWSDGCRELLRRGSCYGVADVVVSDCLKLHDRLLLSTMGTKPVKRGVGSSTELPPPLPSRFSMLLADRA